MKLFVRIANAIAYVGRGHRGAGVTMFVCGESGVKWDVQSMTRAEVLS